MSTTTGLAKAPTELTGPLSGLAPGSNVQYQVGYTAEDPRVAAYRMGLIEEARQLYGMPLDLPAYQVAEESRGQIQAADLARQGIGAYEPYLQAGSQSITQGQTLAQQAANLAGGLDVAPEYKSAQEALGRGLGSADYMAGYGFDAGVGLDEVRSGIGGLQYARQLLPGYLPPGEQGSFTDAGVAKKYETPYMQQVVDVQQKEARRQDEIAQQARNAQAVKAGAFGGTRQAVAEAEAQRGLQDRLAQIQATGSQQAFQQAQQQYNVEQQQRQQQQQLGQAGVQLYGSLAGQEAQMGGMLPAQIAQTQAGIEAQRAGLYGSLGQGLGGLAAQRAGIDLQRAGTLGQMGQGIGQLGVNQAALGQAATQLGQADVSAMMGIGAMEQANRQAQIDAIRATQMMDTMAPFQQLGFVSDIYRGAPSTQSSLIASSMPSASPFQTAAGLGIAGLGTLAGMSRLSNATGGGSNTGSSGLFG
jgi:hypothetical protein